MLLELNCWFRWKLAWLLNRLDDMCWVKLTIWATYVVEHPFSEIFRLRHTAGKCERLGERFYCGKCAVRRYHGKAVKR